MRHLIPPAVQVVSMVCEECGKPCRNKTQKDLHTKHTGHARYVDKVANTHSALIRYYLEQAVMSAGACEQEARVQIEVHVFVADE